MSFAVPGMTHCKNCLSTLDIHEFVLCDRCRKEEEKEIKEQQEKIRKKQQEQEIEKLVEKRVKQELVKLTKKIEKIIVITPEGLENTFEGYWENNKFYLI